MNRSPQPLDRLAWVDPSTLHANDYNPNHVFGPEFELLRTSILEDGWTQPIVARPDGEIVDGFHRWTLGSKCEKVRALTGGLVPVVYLATGTTREQQLMATVRHNRARGKHGVVKMAKIVVQLKDSGMAPEDICARLGMEREEYDRFANPGGLVGVQGKESFGKGWVPDASRKGDIIAKNNAKKREAKK